MQQHRIRITDFDSRRLRSLVEGSRSKDQQDAGSVELLDRHLDDAEITPAYRVGPDLVTMGSEVRILDLDTHETIAFRVVFPKDADAAVGKVSVLAPLGMAVLGRRVGDDIKWQTPGGLRRLRVDRIVYQPEREGLDLGSEGLEVCAAGWFA